MPSVATEEMPSVATEHISSGEMSEHVVFPRPEWGRHGSPRADTLGKRSHGLQEGFLIPPGPPGGHILIKNGPTDPQIRKSDFPIFFIIF